MSNTPVANFEMYISKVSVNKSLGGEMKWSAVASDIAPDLYQECMSNELYDDFVKRIETKSAVPEPFDKVLGEDWAGGMPYLSISHYKSGSNAKNVPGMPDKVYRDGDALKAVGTLYDNSIGRAVFKSLCDDLYTEKTKDLGKIRISIGFLDLEHKHLGEGKSPDFMFTRKGLTDVCPMCQEGIGNKIYTRGQLVHLALTRVPVNPRTDMEVSKAMDIKTKQDDAESIIGKELSETLEEKSLVNSEVLVIKSDSESNEEKSTMKHDEKGEKEPASSQTAAEEDAEMKKEHDKMNMKKSAVVEKKKVAPDKQNEEVIQDEPDEDKREARRNTPAGEKSLLQKSFEVIESKVVELKSQGVPAETALRDIQPAYNALGEQIRKSLQPEQSLTTPSNELAELTSIVKSLAETITNMQQTMSTKIATLEAQTLAGKVTKSQNIPVPRSLNGANLPVQPAKDPSKPLSISELAYRSTFR